MGHYLPPNNNNKNQNYNDENQSYNDGDADTAAADNDDDDDDDDNVDDNVPECWSWNEYRNRQTMLSVAVNLTHQSLSDIS